MNLCYLSKENEQFVRSYKSFGYKTKSQLLNEAIEHLRHKEVQEQREILLRKESTKYGKSKPEYAWIPLDNEDFIDDA